MSVEDRLHHLAESIHGMPVAGFSERETERSLVEPFLDALGYESRNPSEVLTQYPIRIGSTTTSCDYAIKVGDEVRVLVEAKRPSVSLESPGQLDSYFSRVPTALLGIYTNGLEYRFYAERNRGRVKQMDGDSFLVLDLRRLDPTAISRAARCSKSHLSDAEGFQNWVTDLGYSRVIHDRLRHELTGHPSDELVHLAMGWAGVAMRTTEEVSRFREIVRDAVRRIVSGAVAPPPTVGDGHTPPPRVGDGHITALERFEQAFPSCSTYRMQHYTRIEIRPYASIYFNHGEKNRYLACINIKAAKNFPNADALIAELSNTVQSKSRIRAYSYDYRVGPDQWDRVIELMQSDSPR